MKSTVKRVLWQRALDATVLRRLLPVAPAPASPGIKERLTVDVRVDTNKLEAQLARWQRALERIGAQEVGTRLGWHDPTEFRRQEDGSMKPFRPHRATLFGMNFAQGGLLDQTIVRLVGERGPEVRLTIPVGGPRVPQGFSRYTDQFLLSLPQMVREINEASGGRDADVPR
ncbi:hypothetical protein [Azohydromonas lata]|uniref:hypothetical protein n=1 Tax=Azohydromonas lata TaxID=45677 RepID=UPI00083215CA|nr:hypothetical protein [Azohydromonas lata]